MFIAISAHALERMEERGITEKEVTESLNNPDKEEYRNDTFFAMKLRKNGHLLIVIYKKDDNINKVITVIDTSKLEKYL